jgi:hypothetical protein
MRERLLGDQRADPPEMLDDARTSATKRPSSSTGL